MQRQTAADLQPRCGEQPGSPAYPWHAWGASFGSLLWLPFLLCALFYLLAELFLPD